MALEDFRDKIFQCVKIGSCLAHEIDPAKRVWEPMCPPLERFRWHAYYAGGMMWMARSILRGRLSYSSDMADILSKCTTCGFCDWKCRNKIPATAIIEQMKEDMVGAGFDPMPGQKEAAESILSNHNPYQQPHEERFVWMSWLEKPLPAKADVVYFVGCTSAYQRPLIAQAAIRNLLNAGVNFTVLQDEWCSGEPLIRIGMKDKAEETISHNIEAIKSYGAKTVVFSDPHAYAALSKRLAEQNIESAHMVVYMNELVKAGQLKINKVSGKKVTYHDPCYLGRRSGVYTEPRELLAAMGFEVVEMPRNKDIAWCCGAGGGVIFGDPDYAQWTANKRLREARETGCDTLITACPLCKYNFDKANPGEITIIDINEAVIQVTKHGKLLEEQPIYSPPQNIS